MQRDTRYDYPISILIEETRKNKSLLLPQQIWIQLGIASIDGKCWGRPDLKVINDYFQAHRVDVHQSEIGIIGMAIVELQAMQRKITLGTIRQEIERTHKYKMTEPHISEILRSEHIGEERLRYVGTLAPGSPCESKFCNATDTRAKWRINTTGFDGSGMNLCDEHAVVVLHRSGDEKLIKQGRQHGLDI